MGDRQSYTHSQHDNSYAHTEENFPPSFPQQNINTVVEQNKTAITKIVDTVLRFLRKKQYSKLNQQGTTILHNLITKHLQRNKPLQPFKGSSKET